ncbi:MAG TPA: SRPBCC domain-containing protein [Flavobacteriales bacterium]|nr:SRPBCC domain-containing protein [Flavobacteriales bacterium]
MKEREIHTTRVITAARERVFAAWTEPEQLARWWGPNGFTNTFHRFELKPEGIWDFTMHGPNAMDFNNTCVFKRIEPPSFLEFDHLKEMHFYKAMVTFTEVPEGTRIDWTMRFDTAEDLSPIRAFIAKANDENMDKLEFTLNPERAGNFPPQQ